MWDKLKGKSKEEKVEATRLEIQKMTDKCVADFKKGVVHELGKLGIKEPSMTLTGYPTILVPSFIIAKFDDNESRPVISIQFLELYMGTHQAPGEQSRKCIQAWLSSSQRSPGRSRSPWSIERSAKGF